jgi:hypothetical protein
MFFENFLLSGSASTSITNGDSMTLIDSTYSSDHSLTLMNNGDLIAENWLAKITSNTARIVVYNGNNGSITFNVSFIENFSSEAFGCWSRRARICGIFRRNHHSNKQRFDRCPSSRGSSLEYLLYVLIAVVAVVISLVVILRNRKNKAQLDCLWISKQQK